MTYAMSNPSGAEETGMGEVGVGDNVAGGKVGVELAGTGLGVEVAVGTIVGIGLAIPHAASRTTRIIIYSALIVCFIPTSAKS
jgi:hypothetical protein